MSAEDVLLASGEPAADESPPVPDRRKGRDPLKLAVAGLLGFLFVFGAGLTVLGSPSDGEPVVSLRLAPVPGSDAPVSEQVAAGDFRTERSVDGHLVADPALIEDSPQGPLPIVAADGQAPMTAYASDYDRSNGLPKLAVVISGLDVGMTRTTQALARLPAGITLAFSPFAPDVQIWLDKARGGGHEVLMEVPMEPFDFPDSDPGPRALLVGASRDENIKRLHWAMSRATGYVGIANIFGGRFMGEASAIEPVLGEAARRGVLFFDTGASSSSVVVTGARHVGATIATGTLVLDGVQTPAAIDGKLAELESQAHRDGFAIGVGAPYPVTIERVALWAESAASRGIQLVPISAVAMRPPEVNAGVASSE